MTQKIIKIGTSAGVTIPKSSLEKLNLCVGDTIELEANQNTGQIIITSAERTLSKDEHVGKIALSIIDRYRKDFEALADK